MFLFLKKKTEEVDKPEVGAAVNRTYPLSDFIPYYCHYDMTTLLTKNGELLKVIKISSNVYGLNYESGEGTANTVRDVIRRSIMENITSSRFSLWVHTLRRREPVSYECNFQQPLAVYTHENWKKNHDWKYQYYNEIYISIMHDGQRGNLLDRHSLPNVVLPTRNRNFRNQFLQQSLDELNTAANNILKQISPNYNARYLTITERMPDTSSSEQHKPCFFSEPMEFLGTLVNLRSEPFPVTEQHIDKALSQNPVTFGYNALETSSPSSEKRFGGILTLKQYHETPPETVDRILQLPMELVVCQSFHYIPSNIAIKQYKEQKTLFEMSEDIYSFKKSGLESKLRAQKKDPHPFSRHQLSIMVLVDDYKQLEPEVSKAQQAFAKSGFLVVREDIKLEEAYWSFLPGNFEFCRRQETIISQEAAGLTRLNLFPNGTSKGNHWGDAVALMPTVVNSPYFFNFHYHDNGHTLLYDFNSFHDHSGLILLNFLITSTLKFNPKLYVFDHAQSSRLYFDKLEGTYNIFQTGHKEQSGCRLNPFLLEPTARNQAFLVAWCSTLAEPYLTISDQHREQLQAALQQLCGSPTTQRHLGTLIELLSQMGGQELAQALSHYHGRGEYAGLFDSVTDNLDISTALNGFDLSHISKAPSCMIALFSYILHRIILTLDGAPTVIVLHHVWSLLENAFFIPRLESLLEMLRQNNVMVIFSVRNPQEFINTHTLGTLMKSCATRLYLPDNISLEYASEPLGLSTHDSALLRRLERNKGDFLIKQNNEAVALRANFDHMDDIRAIFAGDIKNLIAAGGRFASLPQFY